MEAASVRFGRAAPLLTVTLLSLVATVPPATAVLEISVVAPVGGEVWTGNSTHTLVWDLLTETNNNVDVEYLVNGTPAGLIESRSLLLLGRYTTAWTTPIQNLTDVQIRVCVTDETPFPCDSSPSFRIDGSRPVLASRSPEGSNVALDEPIVLEFSEYVNNSMVANGFSILPNPGNLAFSEAGSTSVRVDHNPFAIGTTHWVTIGCATTDASDPGNPVAECPVSWSFLTARRPSISVASPGGGEVWTGGSIHPVSWIASDPEDSPSSLQVWINYTLDGNAWSPLAGPVPGDSPPIAWSVPLADTSGARIRAEVQDTRGLPAMATSPAFAIDSTPPSIATVSPSDASREVEWTASATVSFTEPVVGPLNESTLSLRSAAGSYVAGSVTRTSPAEIRFTPSARLEPATTYVARLNSTLRDASDPGNPVSGTPYVWSFLTKLNLAPSVSLSFASDPVLSGGSSWTVSWSASDSEDAAAQLRVYIEFSDGGPFVLEAGPLPSMGLDYWTAPSRDLPNAALRARVVDSWGLEAMDGAGFGIDATPPSIVAAEPRPGSAGVALDAAIRIGFSEPIDPETVSIGLQNSDGNWLDLSATWENPETIRLTPFRSLREVMTYLVVVNGTTRDFSSPGNLLANTSWSFTTGSFPPTLALLAPAEGTRLTAAVAQSIHLHAMDGQDASVNVTVDLAVDGLTFSPLIPRTSVPLGEVSFSFVPPRVEAARAVLRACASDLSGLVGCRTVSFAIDATPPEIVSWTPATGAQRVRPTNLIILRFSESMNPASVEAAISLNPTSALTFSWGRTSEDFDTVWIDHERLAEHEMYSVTLACAARDTGEPGLMISTVCPFTTWFTTAESPHVRVLSPEGGERLTGGVEHTIRWFMTGEDSVLSARVLISLDGGGNWTGLGEPQSYSLGETRLPVDLPREDSDRAVVRLMVEDSLGLNASAQSLPFTLDTTAPTILEMSPRHGATEVPLFEEIRIVFSESMVPPRYEVLNVTPNPPDYDRIWTTTRETFDTLLFFNHTHFELSTTVRVEIGQIRDTSRPGNLFLGDVSSFRTIEDVESPLPRLQVVPEALEGQVVVFDATASTDNGRIANYNWTVRDENDTVVSRLAGASVEYRAPRPGTFNVTVEVSDAAGNRAYASAPLRVRAATSDTGLSTTSVSVLGFLAVAGTAGATAFSFTDRGRSWLTRLLVLPLYVKMKGAAVMDHETRGMIRGYVLVNPGDCYTDIKRNLGLANGELAYHLQVLEREGIIRSVTRGARRAYYPADVPIPENGGGLHEIQGRMLRNIEETPGMAVRDLAGLLGISSQLAMYHLRKLGEEGLVRFERKGVRLTVYPTTDEERRRHLDRLENT